MACRLCEGYKIKVSLLEEHIKDLGQRIKELQRINHTLFDNLKNSQANENWKLQYENLVAQNHSLKAQIHMIKKSSHFKDLNSTKPGTPISNKTIKTRNQSTTKALSLYQTPRSKAKTLSSQKMSTFMSTIKKNQIKKAGLLKSIQSQSKKHNFSDRSPSSLFKSRNQPSYKENKENFYQTKSINFSKKSPRNHQKIAQLFGPTQNKSQRKAKGKTLIELLVQG